MKHVLSSLAEGAAMRSLASGSSENQMLSLEANIGKIKISFMISKSEMKREYEDFSSVTWRVIVI